MTESYFNACVTVLCLNYTLCSMLGLSEFVRLHVSFMLMRFAQESTCAPMLLVGRQTGILS